MSLNLPFLKFIVMHCVVVCIFIAVIFSSVIVCLLRVGLGSLLFVGRIVLF